VRIPLDVNDDNKLAEVIASCVGTKLLSKHSELAVKMALSAVKTVLLDENGRREIDIKRYAKVEKIPGGSLEDSQVLSGESS